MFKKFGNAPFYLARLEDKPTIFDVPSPEVGD
jgi:hypothetical protein